MDSGTSHHKRQRSDDSSTAVKRTRHDQNELQPPNGLAHLPEEVLLLILDTILGALIRCHDLEIVLRHVAALHSLSLTNKKFNRLATPYLCTFITNRNRRKLPQVLDVMILDPKKAERIKHISWVLDVRRSSQAMCRRSPKAETTFLQKLGRLGIPELAGDLRQCFHGNSPEYHLATALVLAPNLEYLEAADVNYEQETFDDATWRPTWLELLALKALSRPLGLAQHFQALHHLQLGMGELSFEQIGPLLRLPALRTLHLVGGRHSGRIASQPWDEAVGKRCSTLETLIFERCSVSSQIVAQVLDAIKCLKILKLEINYWSSGFESDDDDSSGQQHSWPKLSEAISEHKESLERLYLIDGGSDPWEEYDRRRDPNPLGQEYMECLRNLPNLRYLDTGFMPFPSELTPPRASLQHMLLPSLEHLVLKAEETLEHATDAFRNCLQDLATNCRSRLPLLRDIMIWLPKISHAARMNLSACQVEFARQGIDLVILCYDDGADYDSSDCGTRDPIWRLHPSTTESDLGQLRSTVGYRVSTDGRARVVLHGPCNAYHDPYGWSIIDDLQNRPRNE
jgi:hypothetical protein